MRIDPLTVAIMFGAGLIALGLTFWMLNRAWGDFPGRAGLPPTYSAERPGLGPPPDTGAAKMRDNGGDEQALPDLPAGAPADGLVPVTHPAVRRAVEAALERGGSPYATYFVRHGERIYLALYRIADPGQREAARRMVEGLNGGEIGDASLAESIRVIQQLSR